MNDEMLKQVQRRPCPPAIQTAVNELDELFKQAKGRYDQNVSTQTGLATDEEVTSQCSSFRDMHFASMATHSISRIFCIADPIGESWKGAI